MPQTQAYVIVCLDESISPELSNRRSEEIWKALETLVSTLVKEEEGLLPGTTSEGLLFAWKTSSEHKVSAKEAYAWRGVIEGIKSADLYTLASKMTNDPETAVLLRDRPAMLKVAGEIANALFHSYTAGHSISFQKCPNSPSSPAL